MKTSKEKAIELVEFFKPLVYCYMGSGMLSDDYDKKVVLENAKKCALKVVEECINSTHSDKRANSVLDKEYWIKVKKEIELL